MYEVEKNVFYINQLRNKNQDQINRNIYVKIWPLTVN